MDEGIEFDLENGGYTGGKDGEGNFEPLADKDKNLIFDDFGKPSFTAILAILIVIAIVVIIILVVNDYGPFAGLLQDIKMRMNSR